MTLELANSLRKEQLSKRLWLFGHLLFSGALSHLLLLLLRLFFLFFFLHRLLLIWNKAPNVGFVITIARGKQIVGCNGERIDTVDGVFMVIELRNRVIPLRR